MDPRLIGAPVMVHWHQTLIWAAEKLASLDGKQLRHLKVDSGEHIAAILATACLGVAPSAVDIDGGLDMLFRLEATNERAALWRTSKIAAFEVKSVKGYFREWNRGLDRERDRGKSVIGASMQVMARSASDILSETRPVLEKMQAKLLSKTSSHESCSRNALLIVHPFDQLALEAFRDGPLGPLLPTIDGFDFLDSLWVIWFPNKVTIWSKVDGWIDVMFSMNPDEEPDPDLAPLQRAEARFLELTGWTSSSPYLFGISGRPGRH